MHAKLSLVWKWFINISEKGKVGGYGISELPLHALGVIMPAA